MKKTRSFARARMLVDYTWRATDKGKGERGILREVIDGPIFRVMLRLSIESPFPGFVLRRQIETIKSWEHLAFLIAAEV
jgi:hypothetical protein